MTRAFWQAFGLAFSAVVGGSVWLVMYMAALPSIASVPAGAFVFLLVAAGMHWWLDEHAAADEPQEVDPWEHGRDTLHQGHVPASLHALMTDTDETRVLSARDFLGYRGEKRRLRAGGGR